MFFLFAKDNFFFLMVLLSLLRFRFANKITPYLNSIPFLGDGVGVFHDDDITKGFGDMTCLVKHVL